MYEIAEDNTVFKNLRNNKISKFLLAKFKTIEEDYKSMEANDPLFLPFYYYLGVRSKAKTAMEIGLGHGLCSGSFLMGNKTVENFIAVHENNGYYNKGISVRNSKKYYKGKYEFFNNLEQVNANSELIIIREKDKTKLSNYLAWAWDHIPPDGKICCDHVRDNEDVLNTFCKSRTIRDVRYYETRYKIAIVTK